MPATTTVPREQILDAMQQAGIYEEDLREDYSGRAMYGDTCFGLTCDLSQVLLFAAALGSEPVDWDWIGGARSDSMGLSTIWYWPGVQLSEEATG